MNECGPRACHRPGPLGSTLARGLTVSHSTAPAWRWLALPRLGIGYLACGDQLYQVRELDLTHPDGSGCRVWQLETREGLAIVIEPSPEGGLRCSACGDDCDHCRAVRWLAERERLAAALTGHNERGE